MKAVVNFVLFSYVNYTHPYRKCDFWSSCVNCIMFVCILRKSASALIIWTFDKLFCSSVCWWTDVELVNDPRLSLFPPQSNRCLCHRWILSHRCWSVRPPSIRLWSCGYETWRNTTMRCGERSACCPGSRPIAAIIATVAKATTCTPIPLKRVQVIARLKKELPRATARTVCLSLWWTNVRLVFWINTLHWTDSDIIKTLVLILSSKSYVLLRRGQVCCYLTYWSGLRFYDFGWQNKWTNPSELHWRRDGWKLA